MKQWAFQNRLTRNNGIPKKKSYTQHQQQHWSLIGPTVNRRFFIRNLHCNRIQISHCWGKKNNNEQEKLNLVIPDVDGGFIYIRIYIESPQKRERDEQKLKKRIHQLFARSKPRCAFIGHFVFLCCSFFFLLLFYQFILNASPYSAHTHLYVSEWKNYWALSGKFIANVFFFLCHIFSMDFLKPTVLIAFVSLSFAQRLARWIVEIYERTAKI